VWRILTLLVVLGVALVGGGALGHSVRTWDPSPATIERRPGNEAGAPYDPFLSRLNLFGGLGGWFEWWKFDYWMELGQTASGLFAVYIAYSELKRIRRQLEERPNIEIGLHSYELSDGRPVITSDEISLTASFLNDEEISEPLRLVVHTANTGTAIASNILWNFDFEKGVILPPNFSDRWNYMSEDTFERLIPSVDRILPEDVATLTFSLKVPRGMSRFSLNVGVSYTGHQDRSETHRTRKRLHVSVIEGRSGASLGGR
jgi:hypothetical protein